uniref:Uncharacterized protein n=1 Tax=Populus trichocarpa TaxID=3694 RepID=A0A3N7G718_POPTR
MQSIDFFQVMKWKSMDAKDWIFFLFDFQCSLCFCIWV